MVDVARALHVVARALHVQRAPVVRFLYSAVMHLSLCTGVPSLVCLAQIEDGIAHERCLGAKIVDFIGVFIKRKI